MIKKTLLSIGVCTFLVGSSLLGSDLKTSCETKEGSFIFAGGECIQFYKADGETKGALNIIIHGNWPEGTNTLGRYAPFADNIAMSTDVTTVAVALPGYSESSTNKLQPLIKSPKDKPYAATKEYVEFLNQLVSNLKAKYHAQKITYIGHSAGAMMGATLSGMKPDLIQNIALAGGRYNIHEVSKEKGLISATDLIDKMNKNMKMVLTYGTKDTISEPKVTTDFYKLAKEKGLDVKLVEVKDGVHLDLDMTDENVQAIVGMNE